MKLTDAEFLADPQLALEEQQRFDRWMQLVDWVVPRLDPTCDKLTTLHLIAAHLHAHHDDGLQDAQWILDRLANALTGRDKTVLSRASKAIAELRALNARDKEGGE